MGFTLVELLVVLAIITMLSAVFIFQQRRFDSSTLLRSLAYSVALSIRQAQTYGTSVRQFGTSAGSFNYSYGVYFSTGDASHYYLFADKPPYDKQRAVDGSEDVQRFTIGKGYTLVQFCASPSAGGSPQCTDSSGSALTWLVVYFKRPNPDACFATNNDASACSTTASTYKDAYIRIQGPTGGANDTRRISVTNTGQISVGAFGS
ncbi:MAG: hypothetical protein G01um101456_312 [Parcubacteria group bacterium Gr01-1014_56]|nr:MAG: hypothetical protein G01um101456_312 [Parcubacteria group bacterium Gr01-1014_56]